MRYYKISWMQVCVYQLDFPHLEIPLMVILFFFWFSNLVQKKALKFSSFCTHPKPSSKNKIKIKKIKIGHYELGQCPTYSKIAFRYFKKNILLSMWKNIYMCFLEKYFYFGSVLKYGITQNFRIFNGNIYVLLFSFCPCSLLSRIILSLYPFLLSFLSNFYFLLSSRWSHHLYWGAGN